MPQGSAQVAGVPLKDLDSFLGFNPELHTCVYVAREIIIESV